VADREIGIALPPQRAEPADHPQRNALAPRGAAAVIAQPVVALPLELALEAARLTRRHPQDVRRLEPGQLARDRLHDDRPSRHRLRLPSPPPGLVHRPAVAGRADIFKCLWGGHLQCLPQAGFFFLTPGEATE